MTSPRLLATFATIALVGSACKAFEVEPIKVALISVPTTQGQSGYTTMPSAVFIEGTGIGLASTEVGQEGCIDRPLGTSGSIQNFSYLDAGPAITAHFAGADQTLTRTTADGRTTYAMAQGTSLAFTPGDEITVTIPGAAGGFPARQATGRTAEAFTASEIRLPGSLTADMPVTWTPVPDRAGSAMFYSIRYSSIGATQDREIACVFRDDGAGVIGASVLTNFRSSSNRTGVAQRARISASQTGAVITHITSTFEVPLVLNEAT